MIVLSSEKECFLKEIKAPVTVGIPPEDAVRDMCKQAFSFFDLSFPLAQYETESDLSAVDTCRGRDFPDELTTFNGTVHRNR